MACFFLHVCTISLQRYNNVRRWGIFAESRQIINMRKRQLAGLAKFKGTLSDKLRHCLQQVTFNTFKAGINYAKPGLAGFLHRCYYHIPAEGKMFSAILDTQLYRIQPNKSQSLNVCNRILDSHRLLTTGTSR